MPVKFVKPCLDIKWTLLSDINSAWALSADGSCYHDVITWSVAGRGRAGNSNWFRPVFVLLVPPASAGKCHARSRRYVNLITLTWRGFLSWPSVKTETSQQVCLRVGHCCPSIISKITTTVFYKQFSDSDFLPNSLLPHLLPSWGWWIRIWWWFSQ